MPARSSISFNQEMLKDLVLRDNQKATCSDNQPMHLMVEHASLGATPVKPEAAGGGGLKGQALRA